MLISQAFAQGAVATADVAAPSPLWNFGMLIVMVVLFYVLLILPQQKRFKEHSKVLAALQKGDRVVTGGGLIGVVDKIVNDDELVIDLGGGVKVTALRATISSKVDKNTSAPNKAASVPKDDPVQDNKSAPVVKSKTESAPKKAPAAKKNSKAKE